MPIVKNTHEEEPNSQEVADNLEVIDILVVVNNQVVIDIPSVVIDIHPLEAVNILPLVVASNLPLVPGIQVHHQILLVLIGILRGQYNLVGPYLEHPEGLGIP